VTEAVAPDTASRAATQEDAWTSRLATRSCRPRPRRSPACAARRVPNHLRMSRGSQGKGPAMPADMLRSFVFARHAESAANAADVLNTGHKTQPGRCPHFRDGTPPCGPGGPVRQRNSKDTVTR
jgi:hypothetical protein